MWTKTEVAVFFLCAVTGAIIGSLIGRVLFGG